MLYGRLILLIVLRLDLLRGILESRNCGLDLVLSFQIKNSITQIVGFSLPSSVLNSNFFTTEFPLNLGQRRLKINTKKIKKRISRYELALKYQKMVNDPNIGTRAALARKLGVSRAWVTIVMRELG